LIEGNPLKQALACNASLAKLLPRIATGPMNGQPTMRSEAIAKFGLPAANCLPERQRCSAHEVIKIIVVEPTLVPIAGALDNEAMESFE
jgi:hypothetical protein